MRILISNDDGINADGLKVMEKIARTISNDVWIVAPELDQSGSSHALTLRDPIRIRQLDKKKFAVSGTPTDCILTAAYHLLKDNRPQLVLSGVNHGGNIAEDVTYSGTIAAAIEATLLEIPAIAFSQVTSYPHPPKWSTAEHFGPQVLKSLINQSFGENILINVNFPDAEIDNVKGIKIANQGHRKIEDNLVYCVDPRGKPYYWIGAGNHRYHDSSTPPAPGTDLEAVANHYVSVTPISLDLTHYSTLDKLEQIFSK